MRDIVGMRRTAASILVSCLPLLLAVAAPARAQGNHAVFSRDGIDVWAVGDSGRYVRSLNGGASWAPGSVGTTRLRAVAARGLRVLLAGDGGALRTSTDNGGSWSLVTLAGSPTLRGLAIPSDLVAYAVGDNGTLVKTVNGGTSWTPQASGTSANLTGVAFTDDLNGWVVGAGGFVARTTNGGTTWTPQPPGTASDLLAVDAVGTTVWVVGALGTCWKTSTGGAPWTPVHLKIDSRADVRSVVVQSPTDVVLAGGGGFVRRTTDGGATWSFPVHKLQHPASDVFFAGTKGWLATSKSRVVLSTSDNGATWALPGGTTIFRNWVKRLSVGGNVRGMTVALNGQNPHTLYCFFNNQAWVSRDEGESWQLQGNPVPNASQANAFLVSPKDSNLFVAAVASGATRKVVRSANGRASWDSTLAHAFGEYGIPLEMHPDKPDTLFFGGDSDVLYRSTNFGQTWSPWSSKVFRSPCDIVVVPESDSAVIQVGDGITGSGLGDIWRSTNNSPSFTKQYTSPSVGGGSEVPGMATSRLRNNVTFATSWANGGVERSSDYGLTWPTVSATSSAWGVDIAKDDPNLAMYAVYSGGRSYLTFDGGGSFSFADTTQLPFANYGVFLRDRSVLLAAQSDGGLYKMVVNYFFPQSNAQSLAVTAPNGGENWTAGTVRNVTWSATNVALARIEWRPTNGDPWQLVAEVPGYQGSYAWTVPNVATSQAMVRVSDAWDGSPTDVSNATFTITAISLAVASPNGGEVWQYNAVHPITWVNAGTSHVALDYQVTPGGSWQPIVASTPAGPGSYDWTIPDAEASSARVRVREVGGASSDSSNGGFQIVVPRWGTASPNPMSFGPSVIGQRTVMTLGITNPGSAPLSIASVTSSDPEFQPNRTTFVIPAGGSDTLGIGYRPTSADSDTAVITFASDDPAAPHAITATGWGSSNVDVPPADGAAFALWQNQPNPFSGRTVIRYALPRRSGVRLAIYDLQGHHVRTLAEETQEAGVHAVTFTVPRGAIAAGVYFCRLEAGPFRTTRKLLLLP